MLKTALLEIFERDLRKRLDWWAKLRRERGEGG